MTHDSDLWGPVWLIGMHTGSDLFVHFFTEFTFREHRKRMSTSGHVYGVSTAPSQPLPRYWGCTPLEFLGIDPGTTGKVG